MGIFKRQRLPLLKVDLAREWGLCVRRNVQDTANLKYSSDELQMEYTVQLGISHLCPYRHPVPYQPRLNTSLQHYRLTQSSWSIVDIHDLNWMCSAKTD